MFIVPIFFLIIFKLLLSTQTIIIIGCMTNIPRRELCYLIMHSSCLPFPPVLLHMYWCRLVSRTHRITSNDFFNDYGNQTGKSETNLTVLRLFLITDSRPLLRLYVPSRVGLQAHVQTKMAQVLYRLDSTLLQINQYQVVTAIKIINWIVQWVVI